MASMRESDTGLWLHNKLGATDELWAPPSIASLLTAAVIDNIRLCFHGLSSAVKLKLLLGTLHLPRRTVDEMKGALTEIIQLATLDSDPWVLMVADILKSFPDTGSLNLDLEEQNPNVQDILGELREKVNECEASAMLPLECQYLNKNALTTLAGPLTPPVKHFQLKRKPKSATLRAELLQKSTETAQQLKRSAGVPFHAKGRGLLRKMDTTTPLKGIPKQAPFRSPTAPSVFSPAGNRTPIPPSRTPLRKERGVKLLDISELDMVGAGREAKRRRKTLDAEVVEKPAKEETVVENATPDYAAGLVSTQKNIVELLLETAGMGGSTNRRSGPRGCSRLLLWAQQCPVLLLLRHWRHRGPQEPAAPGLGQRVRSRGLCLPETRVLEQRACAALHQLPARHAQRGPGLVLHPQLRDPASPIFPGSQPAGQPAARGAQCPEPRAAHTVQAAGAHVQQWPEPCRPRAPCAQLAPDAHHAPSRRPRRPDASGGHGGPPGPAPCPAAAQEEPVAHEGADVRCAGDVQDGQQGHAAREGPHPGLHGRLPREPVPGAGRRDPDQAERAHGGPAQVGRPGQHHHAGGHGVRDELRHGPVDALQEVQAHGQRVLGPRRRLGFRFRVPGAFWTRFLNFNVGGFPCV
ncbi:negative elongation factor A isoform X1 [Phacochoerus africanus]|uniref:negative elongation factor A isoform X1 n=1 Tax=Phacochoerus africanus TaxID=41426 RepID=UPI001FDAB670|nr:negative elongation factor A isoform X1 [Phacochoerus africanus]